jgi:serine/threonine-protein kinase
VIGKEIAHYKILGRLGRGGMGVVYKAEDTRLGRVVALKFLNTELLANDSVRRRFLHEARAASVIDHPNVCHVYEVGEAEDGRYFMAMSYCEGRSLRDVIKSGPSPPREAFSIAFGIAQGLWAAHRRNIVHRDIKPANVILTDEGFVRIVDFGLALLIGDSRVTTSGVTVGTVAYMSPEQTSGSTVGPNTDIWSLGVTLYELLTGHLPFRGEVNAALVYSIVHEPHIPLPDSTPAPCARIVERCLEKDPAKRYPTSR